MRQQKSWMALLALLLTFAACKGESPTAPAPGTGGGGGGGGTTPPATVTLALTASNASPVVDSNVVITAQVSQGGQPVPNGTAVEFVANGGVFSAADGGGQSVVKTTTNGIATVTLTSTVSGPVRVRATVANVSQTVDVTFRVTDPTVPPPVTAPSITSVIPAIGSPAGGTPIRIIGKNFTGDVRVLFDIGGATPVEGKVISVTNTTIDVLTPKVTLIVGQEIVADVIVITKAGTVTEERAELADAFTFRAEVLTPRISTITPNSGPVTGNTTVTIFGDGFQHPVQVLFGTAEAKVLTTDFSQIVVQSPSGRDTSPTGSGTVVGPVTVTVRNMFSQTSVTMADGFFYKAAMQITAVGPGEGPFTGGTRVSIDGVGFLAPVTVSIGGFPAQPISVSGTKIIALTPGITLRSCTDVRGPIIVTNVNNGDTATGPEFIYRVPQPVIVDVDPPVAKPGDTVEIVVANALPGPNQIRVGNRTLFPTAVVFHADGSATFTVALPLDFTFGTASCTVGGVTGTRLLPLGQDVTYSNVGSTCSNTAPQALTVNPVNPTDLTCVIPPPPNAVAVPITPPCVAGPDIVAAGTVTGTTDVTVTNTGGQPLIVSSVTVTASSNATITRAPTSATIAPQGSQTFTVTIDPTAVGGYSGTIRINTNDPDTPFVDFCFTGNGT
jgi:hypothetical protein